MLEDQLNKFLHTELYVVENSVAIMTDTLNTLF